MDQNLTCVLHGTADGWPNAVCGELAFSWLAEGCAGWQQAYRLCGARGRVVCVGVPAHGENVSIYTLPLHFGKRIPGSHGGEAVPHEDIPRYLRLWRAGRLSFDGLVTETYPLEQINTAISRMRSGDAVGRCCLDCR